MIDIRTYVIDNFQLYYDFNPSDIGYGIDCNSKVRIVRSHDSTFFSEKRDIDPEKVVWHEWKGVRIPFLFDSKAKNIYEIRDGVLYIQYDIIASSFYFLSGWDEYVCEERDEYGRVPYSSSMLHKLGVAHLPVVNYYFDILFECLKDFSKAERIDLWGEKNFAVFLSHDIDKCMSGWRQSARITLSRGKLLHLTGVLLRRLIGRDEFFNFSKILQLEKEKEATSSFFFLRRVKDSGNILNADYDGSSIKIRKEQNIIEDQGSEIAVHGSYNAHVSSSILADDLRFFRNNDIIGNRFHYLKFDPLETVSILEKSGLKYDATIGFAEEISFRRATCYPFYLFDFKSFTSSGIIELPLNCMDVTLQDEKYLGKKPEDVLAYLKPVLAEVQKFGGVFSILWHNNNLSSIANPRWAQAYLELLDYCNSKNAFQTNGKAILDRILASRKS